MVHVIFAYSACLSNIKGLQDIGDWGTGGATVLGCWGKGVYSTVHAWRLGEGDYNIFELERGGGGGGGGGDSRGGFYVPEWGIQSTSGT